MSTCPDDNELAQLVDGTLADRKRVERHLDTCEPCTRLVGELAWIVAPPRSAPPGYRLVRLLDDTTWEAIDLAHDRRVALGFGAAIDKRLAGVRHANVAVVHEVGELDGEAFVASELPTTSERAWRAHAPHAPIAIILNVWQQALAGLAALHRAGITHGAISPDHIFVEPDGRVLVGAFATPVAKTAGYLAPEQLAGNTASARSDQLGACVSIFESLTGKRPFAGATPGALAVAMIVPPEKPPDLDRKLYTTLARGLAADPERRWPDVDSLAAALVRPQRPRAAMIVVGIAVVAVVLVAWLAR